MKVRLVGSALAAAALLLLASCGDNPGGTIPGADTQATTAVAASVLKADLTAAHGLITVSLQGASSKAASARAATASPLVKMLEDGTLADVLTPAAGVTLPSIRFIAVHPTDGSVFVAFSAVADLGQGLKASFLRIGPDNAVEIVESAATVNAIATENWVSRQDPVAFTSDGAIWYTMAGTDGVALKKYALGATVTMTPDVAMDIKRFFSDGANVFFLGRNRGQVNGDTFLKVLRPGSYTPETLMQTSSPDCWIKDVYLEGTSVILSGRNVTDPDIPTRRYDGIIRMSYDAAAAKWTWFHVYGSATDTGNPGYRVNRRQLKVRYFQAGDGSLDPALCAAVVAPFFTGGAVPAGVRYFEVVDIDKVNLDSARVPAGIAVKLEHKFWYGLLSRYEGFDLDFFYETFLNTGLPDSSYYDGVVLKNQIPEILYPAGNAVLLDTFLFDGLFGSASKTSYVFDGTGAEYIAAVRSATTGASGYFSSISLKSSDAPLAVAWSDGEANLSWFKTWLDANFTYTMRSGVSISNTAYYYDIPVNYEYVPTNLYSLYLDLTTQVYAAGAAGLAYKDTFLSADGTLDNDAAAALVKKFYPDAVLKDSAKDAAVVALPAGWSNSDTGKASIMASLFDLGSPAVSGATALTFPPYFYDYNTNQGLVDNPYLNLDIGTLFDGFANLERFTFSADGSAYGVYRQLNGAGIKLAKLFDGPTGDIGGSVIQRDIAASGFDLLAGNLYYTLTSGGVSGLHAAGFDGSAAVELLSPSEGMEIYSFRLMKTAVSVQIVFTAVDKATGKTMVGRLDTVTGSIVYSEQTGLSATDEIEFYGSF